MRSISMDIFAMPEVTVEGEVFDCVFLAANRHSGYIVAVPGKKSKKMDKRDKHGVGLQAKTVAQGMIRHSLTVFDIPAVICSDRGTQFVGAWFRTMCKYMGVRHANTMAYHSRSNGRAEVADRQLFEKFRQLHIQEPGRNRYHCLWRVLQAHHDLPGPSGLSPNRILFLRDPVSRTLPWTNHGNVAKEATTMISEADDTPRKCVMPWWRNMRSGPSTSIPGTFTSIGLKTPCGWSGTTRTSRPGTGSSHDIYRVSYCERPGRMSM